jgi:hypothetical protein
MNTKDINLDRPSLLYYFALIYINNNGGNISVLLTQQSVWLAQRVNQSRYKLSLNFQPFQLVMFTPLKLCNFPLDMGWSKLLAGWLSPRDSIRLLPSARRYQISTFQSVAQTRHLFERILPLIKEDNKSRTKKSLIKEDNKSRTKELLDNWARITSKEKKTYKKNNFLILIFIFSLFVKPYFQN